MNAWRHTPSGVSRHDVGAGAVVAAATLVASVVYVASLWVVVPAVEVPFSVERDMLGDTGFVLVAPFVAPLVGFVVGSVVGLGLAVTLTR